MLYLEQCMLYVCSIYKTDINVLCNTTDKHLIRWTHIFQKFEGHDVDINGWYLHYTFWGAGGILRSVPFKNDGHWPWFSNTFSRNTFFLIDIILGIYKFRNDQWQYMKSGAILGTLLIQTLSMKSGDCPQISETSGHLNIIAAVIVTSDHTHIWF